MLPLTYGLGHGVADLVFSCVTDFLHYACCPLHMALGHGSGDLAFSCVTDFFGMLIFVYMGVDTRGPTYVHVCVRKVVHRGHLYLVIVKGSLSGTELLDLAKLVGQPAPGFSCTPPCLVVITAGFGN